MQGKGLRAVQNIHKKGREGVCISTWTSLPGVGGGGGGRGVHDLGALLSKGGGAGGGGGGGGGGRKGLHDLMAHLSKVVRTGVALAHGPIFLRRGEGLH